MNIDIEELKDWENSLITIEELSQFILNRTNNEYFIVPTQMLKDLDERWFEVQKEIINIQELWVKLIDQQRVSQAKWKKEFLTAGCNVK